MGSAFLCIFLVICSYVTVNGGYIKYNTGAGVVEGKLNVHLVPHSHDDVGWLKTIDQYFVGSNNSIQVIDGSFGCDFCRVFRLWVWCN